MTYKNHLLAEAKARNIRNNARRIEEQQTPAPAFEYHPESEFQPRFAAYAKAHNTTPEAMLTADATKHPGGQMVGFISWIGQMRKVFKTAHPEAFLGDSLTDQTAFSDFLADGETT